MESNLQFHSVQLGRESTDTEKVTLVLATVLLLNALLLRVQYTDTHNWSLLTEKRGREMESAQWK